MTLENCILDLLFQNRIVQIEGFGIFSLKNSKALLALDSKKILPPGSLVDFQLNYKQEGKDFYGSVAKLTGKEIEGVKEWVQDTVNQWKSALESSGVLDLNQLGKISIANGSSTFEGIHYAASAETHYGLELVDLEKLHAEGPKNKSKTNKEGSKFPWGWFLLLIPILGLALLFIYQKEFLFGKPSFEQTPLIKKVEKKAPNVDSMKVRADSVMLDSITKAK